MNSATTAMKTKSWNVDSMPCRALMRAKATDRREGFEDLNGETDSDGCCFSPPVVSIDEEISDGEEGGKPTKEESQQRASLVLEGMTREGIREK